LPYVDLLVENLHAYVLRIVQLLEEALGDDGAPGNLDGALLRVALAHRAHLDDLARSGAATVTNDNVQKLLFGER
jgi:hypothetical protein